MRYNDPLAYFLTFTCYGTWLHGNDKGSVDKDYDVYGTPKVAADPGLLEHMRKQLKFEPLKFSPEMCGAVDAAIRETAKYRQWYVLASNVRTNHVHVVVSGRAGPNKMLNDFKAYATRRLRRDKLVDADRPVWTDGGSTRYLWKEEHVARAVHYVKHEQGQDLFDRDDPRWSLPEPSP